MRVLLRSDVDNLGKKGDLVDVADGYARNFLVPKGLALRATPGIEQQAEAMRRNRAARDLRERESAEAVAVRISGQTVTITARAGEGGRLFGSITSADVAEAIHAQFGIEVDRRKIGLDEPLKELGAAELPVRLHPEVVAAVQVEVTAKT